jgi:hypothetical protein
MHKYSKSYQKYAKIAIDRILKRSPSKYTKMQTKRDIVQNIRKWCHVFKKWHLFRQNTVSKKQEISDVRLVKWTLFGDNSLRRFRDQEIQIEHELCFPR